MTMQERRPRLRIADRALAGESTCRGLITLDVEEPDTNTIVTNAVEQVRSPIDSRRHCLTLQLSGDPAHASGDRTRL